MPAGGVPGVPAPEVCCDLGRIDVRHLRFTGLRTYTDAFGFAYQLCDAHYDALVQGLLRCEGLRGTARHQSRPMGRVWSERGTLPKRRR
jgi:hypothetical protein